MVLKAGFVHPWGRLSRSSSAEIPELTTSWCSISRTVRTSALVDHWGSPLRAVLNWSRSPLRTPASRYTVSWPSPASLWIDSHPIACSFLFLLLLVLRNIFKCGSTVIISVATIAASRWTYWCLHCCCVPPCGALFEAPVVQLDSASIAPGWSISGAMTCCCGMVRKMITKRSGKSWKSHS